MSFEQHSADGRTYIDKRVAHQWEVWYDGVHRGTWRFRHQARQQIRALKRGGGQYASRYQRLMAD